MVEAHQLEVGGDVLHVLTEAGAGLGMEDDVGEVFHGHVRGRGHDDVCLPNDRVHARPREENLEEWP